MGILLAGEGFGGGLMVFSDNQGLAAQINRLLPFLARPAGKFLAWVSFFTSDGDVYG